MTFQFFVDDSGSQRESSVMVLCGYLSTNERWAEFEKTWRAVLAKPPGVVAPFKMREAMRLRDSFDKNQGWTEELRNARLVELSSVIRDHCILQLCVWLKYEDFDDYVRSLPVYGKGWALGNQHPYLLLWWKFVFDTYISGRHWGLEQKIDFVFDEQGGYGAETHAVWNKLIGLLQHAPPEISRLIGSPPEFQTDEDCGPLQAADMLAWTNRRVLADEDRNADLPMEALENLVSVPPVTIPITRDWLAANHRQMMERAAEIIAENPDATFTSFDPKLSNRERRALRKNND